MAEHPKAIVMDVESRLDQASLIGCCVRACCLQIGLDETLAYQVQTCTVEAVNNAIIHAYGCEEGHRVRVSWRRDAQGLEIRVCDNGVTMRALPPEVEPAVDSESGRGWWIMRQWMDEADYETSEGQNAVVLRKRIGTVR